jgi:hypothetical protein
VRDPALSITARYPSLGRPLRVTVLESERFVITGSVTPGRGPARCDEKWSCHAYACIPIPLRDFPPLQRGGKKRRRFPCGTTNQIEIPAFDFGIESETASNLSERRISMPSFTKTSGLFSPSLSPQTRRAKTRAALRLESLNGRLPNDHPTGWSGSPRFRVQVARVWNANWQVPRLPGQFLVIIILIGATSVFSSIDIEGGRASSTERFAAR